MYVSYRIQTFVTHSCVFVQSQNHHIPMNDIVKELNGIENSLSDLEREGVEMEKNLRTCEEGNC